MNNGYYQNPVFPGTLVNKSNIDTLTNNITPSVQDIQTNFNSMDKSYIENILKINNGKKIKISVTIPNLKEEENKVFEGIIESSGKDYIIVSNPNNGEWYLIPMIYLNYVTFEERINY